MASTDDTLTERNVNGTLHTAYGTRGENLTFTAARKWMTALKIPTHKSTYIMSMLML